MSFGLWNVEPAAAAAAAAAAWHVMYVRSLRRRIADGHLSITLSAQLHRYWLAAVL